MHKIDIYDSISKVEKNCWDTLAAYNLFMFYDLLKTFEEGTALPLKPHYVRISDKVKITGSAVCYLENNDRAYLINDLLFGRLRKFKIFRNISFLPALD
jgi:predicted N-acyltransferase